MSYLRDPVQRYADARDKKSSTLTICENVAQTVGNRSNLTAVISANDGEVPRFPSEIRYVPVVHLVLSTITVYHILWLLSIDLNHFMQ